MPGMKLDNDAKIFESRKNVRARLKKIMDPIIENRVTPYVRKRFTACQQSVATYGGCTACHSLVRRYRPDERRSHGVHYDSHAFATVVISLSDYGADYRGGSYVATSHNNRNGHTVALMRGDAVVHQSDLLHGVQVDFVVQ